MVEGLLVEGARRLRSAPDRLLHGARRRAARRALRARPQPKTILVVCYGNICRSPFAAALLARELAARGAEMLVASAGFLGHDHDVPPEGRAAAARRGLDLSTHRSRLVTPVLARAADLVVVMDPELRWSVCDRFGRSPADVFVLGDLDPLPIDTRGIADPVKQPAAAFEASYTRIERCIQALVECLVRPPSP